MGGEKNSGNGEGFYKKKTGPKEKLRGAWFAKIRFQKNRGVVFWR